ncbi:MAG: UDP-N-acetylmuramate dehydrogenase [Eubacteriales bacterium]
MTDLTKFHSLLQQMEADGRIERKKDTPLAGFTSFKVGGPADQLILPHTKEALVELISVVRECKIRYLILGNGSNVLFSDRGYRGAVLLTTALRSYSVEGTKIHADCGVPLGALSVAAAAAGLSGLEFAYGIPGTLGGAVYMNAGAYGGEIADVLESSTCLCSDGQLCELSVEEHAFGYRSSVYQSSGGTVLSATLSLKKGDPTEIQAKMKDFMSRRREKQPLESPSAGSTFKRYPGYYTGKLIEDAGLKGFSVGDAMVSEKHAGFVINAGEATSADILALIEHIKQTIYQKNGILLECEVRIIPETDETEA